MRRMLSAALLTAGSVVILAVVLFGRSHSSAITAPPPQVTKASQRSPATPFSATTIAGQKVSLASLRGKPAVINFFAAWCDPCKREARDFARLDRHYGKRISLVSVAVRTTSRTNLNAFLRTYGMTWPVIWDRNGTITSEYAGMGQPITYLLDGQGRVVYRIIGETTERRIASVLDQLLPAA
jgi:cytochrome c biogenesis protein CcmG/thiol:disulfide interchange protein DsbE